MSWLKAGLILASLLLLVSAVSADIPDVLTLTSSSDWLVANNVDTSTITLHAVNQTSGNDVPGLSVTFSVDDLIYGNVTPSGEVTNGFGEAATVFKVNNKSGTALIRATVYYTVGGAPASTDVIYNQKIDHDSPYTVIYNYQGQVIVYQTTPYTITLKDRWGNPIDDRRNTEIVHLAVGSPTSSAGFYDGGPYVDEIYRPVNASGIVSVVLRVDYRAGENIVWLEPFGSISPTDAYRTVTGVSQDIPYSMTAQIEPTAFPHPYVPADGVSKFYLKFILYDRYGNTAANRTIWVNTTLGGEDNILTSDYFGEIYATYGPKTMTGTIGITATVVDNSSLTSAFTVEFVNTAPVNMILTANPETMPSRDVAPPFTSDIKAKVMDIMGNPVAGETVTFSLGAVTYDGVYNATDAPSLVSTSALTDADGYATVQFRPGGFTTNESDPLFSPTATGHCVVTATWTTSTKSMTVNWKNYPYLSVETSVVPSTVQVNQTVDVTIRLTGDGWALQPHPIDVMLTFDRSGSMAGQKLTDSKTAANSFIDRMNVTRDRVGLFAFSDSFILKNSLTNNFAAVKGNVNNLTASGSTGTRRALKESTDNVILNRNPDPKSVQAIILTTDGAYNIYADPLARGIGVSTTGGCGDGCVNQHYYFAGLGGVLGAPAGQNIFTLQNLSRYASDNTIRVYSISFGSGIPPGSSTWNTLEMLSNATGARHYHAATGGDLLAMYTLIAGQLQSQAGVNTTMNVSFQNVQVNNLTLPGEQVFTYEYVSGTSTKITWPNGTIETIDQTNDWNLDHKLNFNIGTINLGETWEGTFRLRVLKDGNIDVFGNDSTLYFDGAVGPSTLKFPHTFITAIPNLSNNATTADYLEVSNLQCTQTGTIVDFVPLQWNLAYTGLDSTVSEKVSYSTRPPQFSDWVTFDTHSVANTTATDYSSLDVRGKPPGDYWFRVEAFATGKYNQTITSSSVNIGTQGRTYIKLE